MDTENIKHKILSKQFQKVLLCLVLGFLALFIFEIGMHVGFRQASVSFERGNTYYRSFGPNDNPHMMGFFPEVSDAHGVSGKIISINLPNIVVADNDNTEKVVATDVQTVIRKSRAAIMASDLAIGDYVVVIGEPNDTAEVDAKLIRVMSQPSPMPPPGTLPVAQ